ncbi:MAG: helix-turn-helix transcriptional regulator [Phycisphaeraceae bacterium]|nr:helix-turn-helix transcriptional regulator [Phycisphaeraceae bacterium]
MARAATTTDVFNAVAEPRRRQILDLLAAAGPCAVGAIVIALGLPQPAVSKHLGVLREVGLVSVEKHGQSRVYQLNAKEIQAVHEWTRTFERFWTHKLDRIKHRAEARARAQGHPFAIAAAAARKDRAS